MLLNKVVSAYCVDSEEVILATAIIMVNNVQTSCFSYRALLDGVSQSNFMTRSLALTLGLKQSKTTTSISVIGDWLCGSQSNED